MHAITKKAECVMRVRERVAPLVRGRGEPDSGVSDLVTAIEADAALERRLRRFCTARYFSNCGDASSVQSTVESLGALAARDLAIGLAIVHTLDGEPTLHRETRPIWTRSLLAATVAEHFAYDARPQLAERAFVAAMLRNVGD